MRRTRPIGNLPAEATSFIGRRRELAEVKQKLGGGRLVSLVGPGGVGKTRLAVRVAADIGRHFRDGAWIVELAEVSEPSLVENAILAALDLQDQAAGEPIAVLRSYLRDRELLLIVDNCEHLVDAAARVIQEAVTAAPALSVIATSREPLTAPAEQVVSIQPLELPAADMSESLARLQQNEAVRLFTDRATAASASFALTETNRAAVVDLCRRLDGLPLAIELAAVRSRALSPDQMLARLNDRFSLLTSGRRAALPRHQTLRTAMDWSYDLLAIHEQALLRRLCVFAGRFTLEDVEGCADDEVPADQAFEILSSLVEKSLVMRDEVRTVACYRLHETMREYARFRLHDANEEDAIEARCIAYYRGRCLRAAPGARYHLVEWLAWVELEIDNLRALMARCLTRGDLPSAADLVTSLGWFWITRATTEGVRWLDEVLARLSPDTPAPLWTEFLRGFLPILQGDGSSATPWLERAIATARAAEQIAGLSQALAMASVAANMTGNHAHADQLLDEAAAQAGRTDDPAATVGVLQARVFEGFFRGDLRAVHAAAVEGERRGRAAGDLYTSAMMLLNLGLTALVAQQDAQAADALTDGLRIAHRIDDRVAQSYLLGALAVHAGAVGDQTRAAKLLGAAERMRESAGARVNDILAPSLRKTETQAIATLGTSIFEAEVGAGRELSRDAAVTLALREVVAAPTVSPTSAARILGKRQTAVAALVAEGLTNKEIGMRLFISERTVESHVRNILEKLAFTSRAQIAGWMAAPGGGVQTE